MDARRAPALLAKAGQTFDLVTLDPPYGRGLASEVLEALADVAEALLEPGAVVVAEAESGAMLPREVGSLQCSSGPRAYGDTEVWIYQSPEDR